MRCAMSVLHLVVCAVFAAGAPAQTLSSQVARVDATGFHVDTLTMPAKPSHPFQPRGADIVWHFNDPRSITYSVCVGDATNETFLAHNLNNMRLAAHNTDGDGTPLWDFPISGTSAIATASSENSSLGIALAGGREPIGTLPAAVFAFNTAGGNVPIWTYEFPSDYQSADYRGVDVSADGSLVAALGRDTVNNKTLLVILNGDTGAPINSIEFTVQVSAVELSDSGARAVLTRGDTAVVIDTADLSTLHEVSVVGTGGYHRISRDGTAVAIGGFDYTVNKEIEGVWTEVFRRGGEFQYWYGNGVALDEHGDTAFFCNFNFVQNYLTLSYILVDVANDGAEITRFTTTGSGAFQDTAQGAQASADGTKFATISWGTEDNIHPELQIFDRTLTLIGSIDTPGSPFSIDMTADGNYVVIGGKHVHANTFGNGSDSYSYRTGPIDPPTCACDWNVDEVVNSQDFFDFLTDFFASDADFNNDKVTNSQDFFDFLTCFFDGCP
jgi:hypothetical protein